MISNKYKNIYLEFIKKYEEIHICPWHEISKDELFNLADKLISEMDINNQSRFCYFIDYLIKRLNGKTDAHTKFSKVIPIPMNFKLFDNEVYINYPNELKGSKLISINNIPIKVLLDELDETISYGTEGRKRYELEKSLFNIIKLFGLPSLRNDCSIDLLIQKLDCNLIHRKYNKSDKLDESEMFDYDYYLYGNPGKYELLGNILIYHQSSMQNKYEPQLIESFNKLGNTDISMVDTIIVDLRGNTGGNSSLNKYLMNFLKNNKDKKIICLTDYRIFSAGRFVLNDLINIGAITIGEEIGTPFNCFGNSNWFMIDNMKFSVSECYFNPIKNYQASNKDEFRELKEDILSLDIFKPDIMISPKLYDYLNDFDPILEYAINYAKSKTISKF